FGREKTIQMLAWGNGAPATFVRINRLKTEEGEFFSFLSKQKFEWERSARFLNFYKIRKQISLDDFELLREGKGYIQDPSASLAVRVLDPHPNEEILDACAAPGGKTALIAESGAKITAVEKSARRMQVMAGNFKRLGVKGVHLVSGDFLSHPFKHNFDPSTSLRVSGRAAGPRAFDKILIDAPCTGLGTMARHPELRWEKKKEDAVRLGAQALSFLERAAGLVKAGGIIVYSTCTQTAEENRDACEKFLAGHPEFEREHAEGWVGKEFCDSQGNVVVLPGEYETDGVFVCRLKRKK
ncbi:MAG: RsmB/NOP family class I SAM-dependent RNA methyltransferase, partial [candidate division Zixibacteria bacterium]|nr:RsmB/NOP family class I SAM-dependent RNA methyltransferase [candidate division Zixibacteria bacterium]